MDRSTFACSSLALFLVELAVNSEQHEVHANTRISFSFYSCRSKEKKRKKRFERSRLTQVIFSPSATSKQDMSTRGTGTIKAHTHAHFLANRLASVQAFTACTNTANFPNHPALQTQCCGKACSTTCFQALCSTGQLAVPAPLLTVIGAECDIPLSSLPSNTTSEILFQPDVLQVK